MTPDNVDKTGLIREAYRIQGISAGQCRSVFLDWALKLPDTIAPRDAISMLLAEYGAGQPDHPMSAVLRAGMEPPPKRRRRGGQRGRSQNT